MWSSRISHGVVASTKATSWDHVNLLQTPSLGMLELANVEPLIQQSPTFRRLEPTATVHTNVQRRACGQRTLGQPARNRTRAAELSSPGPDVRLTRPLRESIAALLGPRTRGISPRSCAPAWPLQTSVCVAQARAVGSSVLEVRAWGLPSVRSGC